uniref:cDNA FLJ57933, moderately similar to Mitochondrial import inner membranetranslocase subunit Tim23 n=1 Tax=Homo sapiens TaxID=9606 RepID=B4DHQ8_HUMAN|nr:unnamed protein product [Homo sapiens]
MTGAAFGAMNGLRLGLKETQNMAWSKPGNVQILNMVTRQGALWANTLGSLALLYSAFGVIIEKTRGAEDDLNTVAAGTMTGMLYKCTASASRGAGIADGVSFTQCSMLPRLECSGVISASYNLHLPAACLGLPKCRDCSLCPAATPSGK